MTGQRAFNVAAAAVAYGVSESTIRRAIRKTKDDGEFPPPLAAKRVGGKGTFSIHVTALDEWHDRLEDAS